MSLSHDHTGNFFIGQSLILDAHLGLLFRAFHYETPCRVCPKWQTTPPKNPPKQRKVFGFLVNIPPQKSPNVHPKDRRQSRFQEASLE